MNKCAKFVIICTKICGIQWLMHVGEYAAKITERNAETFSRNCDHTCEIVQINANLHVFPCELGKYMIRGFLQHIQHVQQ